MRLHRALAAATVCAISAAVLVASPATAAVRITEGATPDWQPTSASTAGAPDAVAAVEPGQPNAGVVVNEIVYDKVSGIPDDSVELYNAGAVGVDLTGWRISDDKRTEFGTVPAGILAPGAFLVLQNGRDFDFGLGKGDEVVLYDAADAVVDSYAYANTAPLAVWARCPDGTGDWAPATAPSLGAANVCAAATVPGEILINEIDSQPSDWVEFFNPGTEALDISGYEIRDNSDDHRWQFLPGTSIAAGAYLVVAEDTVGLVAGEQKPFRDPIGIGSADRIRLFDAQGALLDDSLPWQGHAAIGGDAAAATLARCPDGEGPFVLARPTPGATNECVLPEVAINEIESNGDATDWVEIVNRGTTPVDLSGWTLMDNDPIGHAADTTPVTAGTVLAPGGYFVFDQNLHFTFGLGGGDTVTVGNASGTTVAEYSYTAHATGVWARCADGTGDFADVPVSTKGSANVCTEAPGGEIPGVVWPGSPDVRIVDATPTFLEDSSGLDVQDTPDGAFLWAVDNGTGTFWKLRVAADGSASFAPGWENGKRARFAKDAGDAAAPGPDTEGITVSGDGSLYVASERDNGAKGVNQNVVLRLDPTAPGPDVVATQQWDLTAQLPAVGANLGIEAVEWVSDADLRGRLLDDTTGVLYDPARYAGHGDGLFFVAVEDTGDVYAFALNADGSSSLVSTIDPGLAGVMALDYDTVLGVLWAVCDDGCDGAAVQITLNGTSEPGVVRVDRPAGMPNLNNEGFATAPASLATNGERPVWWFADGEKSGALHVGTLPAPRDPAVPGVPPVPGAPEVPGAPPVAAVPSGTADRLAATGAAGVEGALLVAIVLLLAGAGVGAVGLRRRMRRA